MSVTPFKKEWDRLSRKKGTQIFKMINFTAKYTLDTGNNVVFFLLNNFGDFNMNTLSASIILTTDS